MCGIGGMIETSLKNDWWIPDQVRDDGVLVVEPWITGLIGVGMTKLERAETYYLEVSLLSLRHLSILYGK